MKKILLYLLLVTYTMGMLKPVLPLVTDIAAHICWYSHHMATVHYENGKYHVHKEMLETSKKDHLPANAPSAKKETTSSEHLLVNTCLSNPLTVSFGKNHFTPLSFHLISADLNSHYPPPKC